MYFRQCFHRILELEVTLRSLNLTSSITGEQVEGQEGRLEQQTELGHEHSESIFILPLLGQFMFFFHMGLRWKGPESGYEGPDGGLQ